MRCAFSMSAYFYKHNNMLSTFSLPFITLMTFPPFYTNPTQPPQHTHDMSCRLQEISQEHRCIIRGGKRWRTIVSFTEIWTLKLLSVWLLISCVQECMGSLPGHIPVTLPTLFHIHIPALTVALCFQLLQLIWMHKLSFKCHINQVEGYCESLRFRHNGQCALLCSSLRVLV